MAMGARGAPLRTDTTFGRFWQDVEALSPRLVRAPLPPEQLASEAELARHALARLPHEDALLTGDAGRPDDSLACASAGAA